MPLSKLFRWLWPGAEIKRLREDCAEAYQVVGALTLMTDPIDYTDADADRILDNLSAAASGYKRPHDDLLPWPMDKPC